MGGSSFPLKHLYSVPYPTDHDVDGLTQQGVLASTS